ncbi:MAG: YdcF family protein [Candidatus Moranbacteria bacterium]|nr:YdcF family protein [Candidatus Moranbacteria bacterium]
MILVHFFDKGQKQEVDVEDNKNLEELKNDKQIKVKKLLSFFEKHLKSFFDNKFFKLIKKPFGSKWFKRIFILGVASFIFLIGINFYIIKSTQDQIYFNQDNLPEYQTALLLGAKVYDDGTLSFIMQDRADTAIEIYNLGKVEKILVSGDHGTTGYDEVNTVKNYLVKKGIPEKDIFTDHAGFDTYDSVYRAKNIFEVRSMIIVTQEFHLPRAIYIANSLGVESVGIVADKRRSFLINYLRENVARIKAFLNVVFGAESEFLGERIPITGESKESWD